MTPDRSAWVIAKRGFLLYWFSLWVFLVFLVTPTHAGKLLLQCQEKSDKDLLHQKVTFIIVNGIISILISIAIAFILIVCCFSHFNEDTQKDAKLLILALYLRNQKYNNDNNIFNNNNISAQRGGSHTRQQDSEGDDEDGNCKKEDEAKKQERFARRRRAIERSVFVLTSELHSSQQSFNDHFHYSSQQQQDNKSEKEIKNVSRPHQHQQHHEADIGFIPSWMDQQLLSNPNAAMSPMHSPKTTEDIDADGKLIKRVIPRSDTNTMETHIIIPSVGVNFINNFVDSHGRPIDVIIITATARPRVHLVLNAVVANILRDVTTRKAAATTSSLTTSSAVAFPQKVKEVPAAEIVTTTMCSTSDYATSALTATERRDDTSCFIVDINSSMDPHNNGTASHIPQRLNGEKNNKNYSNRRQKRNLRISSIVPSESSFPSLQMVAIASHKIDKNKERTFPKITIYKEGYNNHTSTALLDSREASLPFKMPDFCQKGSATTGRAPTRSFSCKRSSTKQSTTTKSFFDVRVDTCNQQQLLRQERNSNRRRSASPFSGILDNNPFNNHRNNPGYISSLATSICTIPSALATATVSRTKIPKMDDIFPTETNSISPPFKVVKCDSHSDGNDSDDGGGGDGDLNAQMGVIDGALKGLAAQRHSLLAPEVLRFYDLFNYKSYESDYCEDEEKTTDDDEIREDVRQERQTVHQSQQPHQQNENRQSHEENAATFINGDTQRECEGKREGGDYVINFRDGFKLLHSLLRQHLDPKKRHEQRSDRCQSQHFHFNPGTEVFRDQQVRNSTNINNNNSKKKGSSKNRNSLWKSGKSKRNPIIFFTDCNLNPHEFDRGKSGSYTAVAGSPLSEKVGCEKTTLVDIVSADHLSSFSYFNMIVDQHNNASSSFRKISLESQNNNNDEIASDATIQESPNLSFAYSHPLSSDQEGVRKSFLVLFCVYLRVVSIKFLRWILGFTNKKVKIYSVDGVTALIGADRGKDTPALTSSPSSKEKQRKKSPRRKRGIEEGALDLNQENFSDLDPSIIRVYKKVNLQEYLRPILSKITSGYISDDLRFGLTRPQGLTVSDQHQGRYWNPWYLNIGLEFTGFLNANQNMQTVSALERAPSEDTLNFSPAYNFVDATVSASVERARIVRGILNGSRNHLIQSGVEGNRQWCMLTEAARLEQQNTQERLEEVRARQQSHEQQPLSPHHHHHQQQQRSNSDKNSIRNPPQSTPHIEGGQEKAATLKVPPRELTKKEISTITWPLQRQTVDEFETFDIITSINGGFLSFSDPDSSKGMENPQKNEESENRINRERDKYQRNRSHAQQNYRGIEAVLGGGIGKPESSPVYVTNSSSSIYNTEKCDSRQRSSAFYCVAQDGTPISEHTGHDNSTTGQEKGNQKGTSWMSPAECPEHVAAIEAYYKMIVEEWDSEERDSAAQRRRRLRRMKTLQSVFKYKLLARYDLKNMEFTLNVA